MKEADVKGDECAEEENFQQDKKLPQIYPRVCLHTTTYQTIHAKKPQQRYPQITVTSDRYISFPVAHTNSLVTTRSPVVS